MMRNGIPKECKLYISTSTQKQSKPLPRIRHGTLTPGRKRRIIHKLSTRLQPKSTARKRLGDDALIRAVVPVLVGLNYCVACLDD